MKYKEAYNEIKNEMDLKSRPTPIMVEHLNLKLKEEGSCLRYISEKYSDCGLTAYNLKVPDKYLDNKYNNTSAYTDEFNTMVREFFKMYGVKNTGYWNTVATLIVYE